ncbi:hypothetical protein T265_10607 [Opisthorchis viverrini]|uniref:Uncharacterized protein n=1 Tax=Opisthorchis viverrini TaxID=6198 RepID=A0A074ZCM3_OPIVI|nr:hypothetical protein T265_10607 [Opisthorchis viverrini]KER20950.1 hypothetical protein T265_10607 [Opisthorchis viverrini]
MDVRLENREANMITTNDQTCCHFQVGSNLQNQIQILVRKEPEARIGKTAISQAVLHKFM